MTSDRSGGAEGFPVNYSSPRKQHMHNVERYVVADAILKPKLQYLQFQPVAVGAGPLIGNCSVSTRGCSDVVGTSGGTVLPFHQAQQLILQQQQQQLQQQQLIQQQQQFQNQQKKKLKLQQLQQQQQQHQQQHSTHMMMGLGMMDQSLYQQAPPGPSMGIVVNNNASSLGPAGMGHVGGMIAGGGAVLSSVNNNTASGVANPLIAGAAGTMVPLDLLKNRQPARVIAIIDAVFATVLLVFHGLTLMVQEMHGEENRSSDQDWLLPTIPMTPGMLNITGYMEVIAWIGILSVNFLQLLVAVSLFNASDKECESLKAFEASRVWLKTCIFLVIILMIKICILYFMYEMNMKAHGTIVFTMLESLFHIVGLVVVLKFFHEIKRNNPLASRIYYQSEDGSSSPKRNNVADAVWF